MMRGSILVVDDEKDMLLLLERIISEETAHEVVTAADPLEALNRFRSKHFDIVVTDLRMPHMDGLQLLEEMRKIRPDVSLVVLTAYATVDNAVEAIRRGACDYLTKPFRKDRILLTIENLMEVQRLLRENNALRRALEDRQDESGIIGSSPVIKSVIEQIRRVSPTSATVLITGPSGTGKELAARTLHAFSRRKDRKLVVVNCTAIPESVLESEFFGHVKGAFTGAVRDKKGLVEEADGGTLFLDEIGDITMGMQTKLLRLLQQGEYKPVGSNITRTADIRFIAATNHNLLEDIKEKRFREDLYYRLNVIQIELPPLCTRPQDIPMLAMHFAQKYARVHEKVIRGISPSAMQTLSGRKYPGNIRELENTIERGVIFCDGDTLRVENLHLDDPSLPFPEMDEELCRLSFKDAKARVIDAFHHRYLIPLLEECDGNISRAAERAGIQRQYLHRLLKEIGIEADEFRSDPE